MYLHRRGSHWWIRKAVPVDLVEILGFAVVRRSLRTKNSALARRRALQLLIRVRELVEAELAILDERCTKLLAAHLPQLDAITDALKRKRALTGEELRALLL